jgi:hypothetical protein
MCRSVTAKKMPSTSSSETASSTYSTVRRMASIAVGSSMTCR